jgi:hypothetical protein
MAEKQSGSSINIPELLSYPEVLQLRDVPELKDQFVYPIEYYSLNGLAVVVTRDKQGDNFLVSLTFGDWDANIVDLTQQDDDNSTNYWGKHYLAKYSDKVLAVMKHIGLSRAELYFSIANNDLILTDIRTHINKFTGPGMVEDLFGKVVPTQRKVVSPLILDEETLDKINKGKRPFNQSMILKPSRFKTITRGKALLPMYALVKR